MSTEAAAATRPAVDLARVKAWLPAYGVYAAIALLVLFNVFFTPNFLTWSNLRIQLIQVAPIVIVALGMALVIGTEGIDLSVGSVMALAAALIPLYLGYGVIAAIVVSLLAGLVVGLINGTLVARVGLQPIVATLALFVGGRGLALVISDGQLKDVRNEDLLYLGSGDLFGLPVLVWIAAVLVLIVAFVVRRTVFGRRLLAIGGNRAAAELAGLPVQAGADHRVRGLLGARLDRRHARGRPHPVQRRLRGRPADRALRDHRGGGRRHPADRRPGPGARHGGRRAAHAAGGGHHDQAQPAAVHDRDGAGRHHPGSPCTWPGRGRPGDPDR